MWSQDKIFISCLRDRSAEAENLRNELNATKQALLEANLQINRMSNSNLVST